MANYEDQIYGAATQVATVLETIESLDLTEPSHRQLTGLAERLQVSSVVLADRMLAVAREVEAAQVARKCR
jgi:hypothetical protein